MKRRPAVVKPEEPFEMYELEIEPDSDNEKKLGGLNLWNFSTAQ